MKENRKVGLALILHSSQVLISLVAQFCAITLFAHYWMDVINYSLTAKAQLLQQTNPTTVSTNHWHYHSFALTTLFQLQVIINAARKDRGKWLKTMPYMASDPWRWSTKEIPITSSIHVFIIYSKTSINSTVLSMFHHKANDHSYSHRAFQYSFCLLCRYSVYSDAIRYSVYSADIRNSSTYEFTWIHLTRKRQLFRYAFIIIASTWEVFSGNYSSYLQIPINQH